MHYGKIKRYFDDRGFGFLLGDDGEELFFHVRGHLPPNTVPNVGARVRYDVRMSSRNNKPEAFDIEEIKSDVMPQKTLRGNDPVFR
jgi:CspA family cold shock protein